MHLDSVRVHEKEPTLNKQGRLFASVISLLDFRCGHFGRECILRISILELDIGETGRVTVTAPVIPHLALTIRTECLCPVISAIEDRM